MRATLEELMAATAPERPRSTKVKVRDEAILSAALALPAFTTREVVERAACTASQGHPDSWYGSASLLFRTLRRQGVLRVAAPETGKPYLYEWVGVVEALEAEVDRLRAVVGEPPLRPRTEAVAS